MSKKRTSVFAAILWFTCLSSAFVHAAEIEKFEVGDVTLIGVTGPIEFGDSEKFDRVTSGIEGVAIIALDSPGGLTSEGLPIAAKIAMSGFSTAVFSGKECASMCAILWISGNNRYLNPDSLVGFHAAYLVYSAGNVEVSGAANAEIGAYLNTLGIPREAIRLMTEAGPSELTLIDAARARAMGIDVVVIDRGQSIAPLDRPTPHSLANLTGALSILSNGCTGFFPAPSPDFSVAIRAAENEALTMVTKSAFDELVYRGLHENFGDLSSVDTARLCVRAESIVRAANENTGFSRPGFDCSEASGPDQLAICSNPAFWASDYIMNAIYESIRSQPDSAIRSQFMSGQKAWLAVRESCGGNTNCISRIYDSRFQDIAELLHGR